jgi:hypothetical protein
MGTEIGMLRGYGFQGQVTAGDGSFKQGKMSTGYNNLKRKKKKQHHEWHYLSTPQRRQHQQNV